MPHDLTRVPVSLPQDSYDVLIAENLLERAGALLKPLLPKARVAILADENVFTRHGSRLESGLRSAGIEVLSHAFDSGEEHKNLETVEALYQQLFQFQFERGDTIIAFGGGVAGDLVGFVAATFLRGLPFIQIPSTLLSMVDASVGGKVGYNTSHGKNLIGAFYQPKAVLIDPSVLRSLPEREYRSGLAECVKHAVLDSSDLFEELTQSATQLRELDMTLLEKMIAKNVRIKAEIVAKDEREQGQRALLNFGHTFGHAIERAAGYGTWLHGEAVSLGMCAASHAAANAGICSPTFVESLETALNVLGLPTRAQLPERSLLMKSMQSDKKVQSGKLRLILPRSIGVLDIVDSLTAEQIHAGWDAIAHERA